MLFAKRMIIVLMPKFLKVFAVFLVDVLMARYLGVTQFGVFSLGFALFVTLVVFSKFGLESALVKERIEGRAEGRSLRKILLTRLVGGVFAQLAFLAVAASQPTLSPHLPYLVALSFGLLAFSFAISEPLYQAEEKFGWLAITQSIVILVGAAVKLGLIYFGAPAGAFWIAILAEALTAALVALVYLIHLGRVEAQQSLAKAKEPDLKHFVRLGFPFLLSSLSVIAFMRLDQIMLSYFWTPDIVGLYSAALRISESFFVLATLASVVLFPQLLRLRAEDEATYVAFFGLLLRAFFYVGMAVSAGLLLTSDALILFLFGLEFQPAAELLRLHAWVIAPAFWGILTHRWLVAEGLGRYELIRTALGLSANVGLNLMLIPTMGAKGACIATVISQCIAYFGMNLAFRPLRPLLSLQLRAVFFRTITSVR